MKKINKQWQCFIKTYFDGSSKQFYLILFFVFGFFIIRSLRLNDLLGFYYDQGRDALVIWDLWHNGKFFLIGPTTGLQGVFLGPWYYYLIAPFYLLGSGNPVFPAMFLIFLTTVASFVGYLMMKTYFGGKSAYIFLTLTLFSRYIFLSSRWLSNPTPIMLSSVVLLWCLFKSVEKKNIFWWTVSSFVAGASLHFESASAIFYVPIIFITYLYVSFFDKKKAPGVNAVFAGVLIYLFVQLPQIIFNFRHHNILLEGVKIAFLEKESFSLSFGSILNDRLVYFSRIVSDLFSPKGNLLSATILSFSFFGFLKNRREIFKNRQFIVLIIFCMVPVVGYIFYQGNNGYLFDYYFTGYFFAVYVLVPLGLSLFIERSGLITTFLVSISILSFAIVNLFSIGNYLEDDLSGPSNITLGNQLKVIDWIVKDVDSSNIDKFNVDVYVPPVIPYAYDYLFLWKLDSICGDELCGLVTDQVGDLYTPYEVDYPHPERLSDWLERQAGIGEVVYEKSFGGIHVQKRKRL